MRSIGRTMRTALNRISSAGPPGTRTGFAGARRALRTALVAPLLLFPWLNACATAGGRPASEGPASEPEPAVVEVTNLNWQTMHVYVLAAGQRWSLGMVTSQSTRDFELPDGVFAAGRDVVFLADPIGSVLAYHSDPVLLEPGDRVQWTLHNRLSHSGILVR